MLLVSHDRHLLRATTDEFLIVADGKLTPFDGDLDDYRDWLFRTKLANREASADTQKDATGGDRRGQKRADAQDRQRLSALRKPIENRIRKLEQQMEAATERKAALDARLADPAVYEAGNKEALRTLLADQAACALALEQLEMEWLEQHEALETVQA